MVVLKNRPSQARRGVRVVDGIGGVGTVSVQSNAIADALVTNFNFNASLVGLVLAAVTFLVISAALNPRCV
ncbi:MAG: hypothetical protein ACLSFJ_07630 [Holdemania filiformis]